MGTVTLDTQTFALSMCVSTPWSESVSASTSLSSLCCKAPLSARPNGVCGSRFAAAALSATRYRYVEKYKPSTRVLLLAPVRVIPALPESCVGISSSASSWFDRYRIFWQYHDQYEAPPVQRWLERCSSASIIRGESIHIIQ